MTAEPGNSSTFENLTKYDLAVFDMDGVLVNYSSSWSWINHVLEIDNSSDLKAYLHKEIDDEEFMRRDISRWMEKRPNLTWDEVTALLEDVPLIAGIRETVAKLHWHDINLDRDQQGVLTGEGLANVDLKDKGPYVVEFQKRYGVSKDRTFAVGNSFSDLPMFKECALGIAFNPIDEKIVQGADVVVKSDTIADILSHVL